MGFCVPLLETLKAIPWLLTLHFGGFGPTLNAIMYISPSFFTVVALYPDLTRSAQNNIFRNLLYERYIRVSSHLIPFPSPGGVQSCRLIQADTHQKLPTLWLPGDVLNAGIVTADHRRWRPLVSTLNQIKKKKKKKINKLLSQNQDKVARNTLWSLSVL